MKSVALLDHHVEGHHKAFIKLFSKYLNKAGYRVFVFFSIQASQLFKDEYENIQFVPFDIKIKKHYKLGRFNQAASALHIWRETKYSLRQVEKSCNVKFDFVFFAWLDDYLANYLSPTLIDVLFPYQWSGLYFHPWYLFDNVGSRVSISSIDSVLLAKRCISVGIHDEFLMDKLAKRINKPVVFFPEIADATPPLDSFDIALQIKDQAKGRIRVGLIGLAKRKGVLHLVELARHADPDSYFFFFAGRIIDEDYSPDELFILKDFFNNLPSHCFYYPDSIEEGEKINAVIHALDILFLIYFNFKSSSNFNTKAAHFKKPVLASNRFWIGEVTKKFAMGVTVDEGNLEQALNGLEKLKSQLDSQAFDFSGYDEYLKLHQEENLIYSFTNVFINGK